jgi:lysophospholipase L1-like esterase
MMEPVEGRRGVIVHNLARFGMTLSQIVDILPDSLAKRDGRGRLIAAAMIGFSESTRKETTKPTVPIDEFCRAVRQFTEICNESGHRVYPLFIEYPPIDIHRPHPHNPGDIDPGRIAEYQTAVKNHAELIGADFIETHAVLCGLSQDPISKDGIHLSVAGHIALHDLLLPRIDALLADQTA